MKHFISCLFSFFILCSAALAQEKTDVILKTNGDELKGKVLEMTDADVKFHYAGETLTYTIKKTEILKITFASGRVEKITDATPAPAQRPVNVPSAAAGDPHNKVAILPFTFTQDGTAVSETVGMEVQNEVNAYMSKHSGVYTLLDPRRTNVLLNKAGVTKETIMNYTMDEICKMLGVEYIIDGMITQTRTSQTNYGSTNGTVKDNGKNTNKEKTTYSGSTYSTNQQYYSTNTQLRVYNDKGVNIYNQNRHSLLGYQDSYKSTIEYLLKRSPLYSR